VVKLTVNTDVNFKMKRLLILIFIFCRLEGTAQNHTPLPHGMIFGDKPANIAPVPASRIEGFMGKKTRVTTAITGKILRVTKEKGGWFDMEAGAGKVIAAHFKNYDITLPKAIEGRTVIVEGVAEKLFIANDMQHMAGDTVKGKQQHVVNPDPKHKLTFEVRGLMVDI
jgi:hypothetical protein